MDAIRLKDKRHVALKRIDLMTARGMNEVEVVNWLYSPDRGDPDNHTVPLLEQLLEDDQKILVMPFLRQCDDPAWDTVGEIMSFLKQVFEVRSLMPPPEPQCGPLISSSSGCRIHAQDERCPSVCAAVPTRSALTLI